MDEYMSNEGINPTLNGEPNSTASHVLKLVVETGAASVNLGGITPQDFVRTLGMSAKLFAQITSDKTGIPTKEVFEAMRQELLEGYSTPFVALKKEDAGKLESTATTAAIHPGNKTTH